MKVRLSANRGTVAAATVHMCADSEAASNTCSRQQRHKHPHTQTGVLSTAALCAHTFVDPAVRTPPQQRAYLQVTQHSHVRARLEQR